MEFIDKAVYTDNKQIALRLGISFSSAARATRLLTRRGYIITNRTNKNRFESKNQKNLIGRKNREEKVQGLFLAKRMVQLMTE